VPDKPSSPPNTSLTRRRHLRARTLALVEHAFFTARLAKTLLRPALGGVGGAGAVARLVHGEAGAGATGVKQRPRQRHQAARPAGRRAVRAGARARLAQAQALAVAGVVELGHLAAALAGHEARRAGALAGLAGGLAGAIAYLPRGVQLGHVRTAAAAHGQPCLGQQDCTVQHLCTSKVRKMLCDVYILVINNKNL